MRITKFVLCVAFAALSVWSFADGESATGGLQLAFSAFWLWAFWGRWPSILSRRYGG
jgi:hypothetical protein